MIKQVYRAAHCRPGVRDWGGRPTPIASRCAASRCESRAARSRRAVSAPDCSIDEAGKGTAPLSPHPLPRAGASHLRFAPGGFG